MLPRLTALALILLLVPAAAAQREARSFAYAMLDGVGAQQSDCPLEVQRQTLQRDMRSVCATFNGTFESFRALWDNRLPDPEPAPGQLRPPARAAAVPQTGWEPRGVHFERIYLVGQTVVGVRFSLGDVIIVYK